MNHQMDEDQKHLPKLQDSYEVGEMMKRSSSSSLSSEHDVDHHDHEMMKEGEIFDEDTAVEGSHKCNICEKTFKNSKALGGHRRSHIHQDLKKKSMTHFSNLSKQGTIRANFNNSDDDDVGDFDDVKTICYVCNKKFPSKNVLCGHMRCHPNRVSKGFSLSFNNSSSSNNSNPSMDQDDGFVAENEKKNSDLSKSPLPKWKNKNKRGKRGGEMYMAATILMTMPKDKNFVPEVLLPIKKRKFAIGESSKGKEIQPVNKTRVVYNGLMMFGRNNVVADASGGSGSNGFSESRVVENKVQKNKSKKKTEENTPNYDPDIGAYKCSLCGKCFSSFQGLGGHKSSHKKYDTSIFLHESNNYDVVAVAANAQENNSSSTSEDVPKVEEVKAVIKEPLAKSSGQKKVKFDLNEQYVMED